VVAPAICTDVASMPEIVEDGVSGFITRQTSPISWLKTDVAQRSSRRGSRYGIGGKTASVSKFTCLVWWSAAWRLQLLRPTWHRRVTRPSESAQSA